MILVTSLFSCNQQVSQTDIDATIAAGIDATQQAEVDVQATVDAAIEATQAVVAEEPTSTATVAPTPTDAPSQSSAEITPIVQTPTSQDGANTPIPAGVSDQEQVRRVILDETEAAAEQDLERLKSLYAPNAIVVDRNGTPNDRSDDTIWQGWANIERRYSAFFSLDVSSISLRQLSILINGDEAVGTHQGAILDGTLFEDNGSYTLTKIDGQWLITQLEYGNKSENEAEAPVAVPNDDGLYELALGSQHRYEEPWGWDRGDPCAAWQTGNFDDTQPNYRGFNVELLLTNNSDEKIPDDWPISFSTANGNTVRACFYGYEGSGPPPGATSSVTFFTVVEKDDYVDTIIFSLNDQVIRLCLDGEGGASGC